MGSISCHITPLVITSLGVDIRTNTHTHTHTDVRIETILRNQLCGRHAPGLKMLKFTQTSYCSMLLSGSEHYMLQSNTSNAMLSLSACFSHFLTVIAKDMYFIGCLLPCLVKDMYFIGCLLCTLCG